MYFSTGIFLGLAGSGGIFRFLLGLFACPRWIAAGWAGLSGKQKPPALAQEAVGEHPTALASGKEQAAVEVLPVHGAA
jgi:hypothetical protein